MRHDTYAGLSDEEARGRFGPTLQEIAAGTRDREAGRILAHDPLRLLGEAGFGRLRVPADRGGMGASLQQSFGLLRALAEADSNLPQIVRAHFAFVEGLRRPGGSDRDRWFARVTGGAWFGAAMAERSDATAIATTVSGETGHLRLNGTKYYSTGTLYADWIIVWAMQNGQRVRVLVPADAPGVTIRDDWDGFGQRLTGSGTTVFDDVALSAEQIVDRVGPDELPAHPYLAAYYQQFHNTALAGITAAILRDAIAFVRPRTRVFGVPGQVIQRDDPVVQSVIGRLSALAFSTASLSDRVSQALAEVEPAWDAGETDERIFAPAQEIAFQAQQVIVEQTLGAATLMFEVGGASATSDTLRLDRHWRNARVLASHNPAAQRQRELGDLALNATPLWTPYREGLRRAGAGGAAP